MNVGTSTQWRTPKEPANGHLHADTIANGHGTRIASAHTHPLDIIGQCLCMRAAPPPMQANRWLSITTFYDVRHYPTSSQVTSQTSGEHLNKFNLPTAQPPLADTANDAPPGNHQTTTPESTTPQLLRSNARKRHEQPKSQTSKPNQRHQQRHQYHRIRPTTDLPNCPRNRCVRPYTHNLP